MIDLGKRIQLPLVESIQTIPLHMLIYELPHKPSDLVMVLEIHMSVLNIVEAFHLHRLVQHVDNTMNKGPLLLGSVSPAKEDHPLLANEDPLLVPPLHHDHQLLRQIVTVVSLVHDCAHCDVGFLFRGLLEFLTV